MNIVISEFFGLWSRSYIVGFYYDPFAASVLGRVCGVFRSYYKNKFLKNSFIFFKYFRDEENLIRNVLNHTIFIRNNVEFKKFDKKL